MPPIMYASISDKAFTPEGVCSFRAMEDRKNSQEMKADMAFGQNFGYGAAPAMNLHPLGAPGFLPENIQNVGRTNIVSGAAFNTSQSAFFPPSGLGSEISPHQVAMPE